MRFLIQRVTHANVQVDDQTVGQIDRGFLVYIGITNSDTNETADFMMKKLWGLRIFRDEFGKTNLSLSAVNGALLLISQFTLYADCKHGYRPSFTDAGAPDHAKALYEYIIDCSKREGFPVATGIFGADMAVTSENEGPFTIMLDSDKLMPPRSNEKQ
ncbi:MAG TPA: D-aminoacyl-tRNA deacylase [Bacillota bacterium]|nr:D-aminoacyl-tRNA deacylase [Bacillota bacterium]HPE38248.1 D-aminoacyl-tRNA deacylase [Bacillota bacterium]